jgi:hypothetical protein
MIGSSGDIDCAGDWIVTTVVEPAASECRTIGRVSRGSENSDPTARVTILIDYLAIKGFKSFENVELNLGALNFFVGTNSSGKSNLFDAIRVLQGIGYGLRVDEIFNGKPKSANSDVWQPIRGGGANAGLLKWDPSKQQRIRSRVTIGVRGESLAGHFDYSITLSPISGKVVRERLSNRDRIVFSNDGLKYTSADAGLWLTQGRQFDNGQPGLSQIESVFESDTAFGDVRALLALLSDCQHLEPIPAVLREYSASREVQRLGERGENFAALVQTILAGKATATAYRSWLERLTPRDLDDIVIVKGALGEPMFALRHGTRRFPAPVLSDGTLRFAALTAAFFQPDMPQTMVLEEIENGIHPSRLRLLVELLKSRASTDRPQIMASTHSPVVVDWLTSEDLDHCFLFRHEEKTGVSLVQPLSTLPRLKEIVKQQPAGELFAEGWMENSA